MPGRFTRDTVILAALETTYGTDAAPTGANAILCSNPSQKVTVNSVDRDLIRPYFGNSQKLSGTSLVEIDFDVETVGSGTAGTPPKWDALIQACAFAVAATASIRVDYFPLTNNQASASIYYIRGGVRHKALGARGKMTCSMREGEIPKFSFAMTGQYSTPTATAAPTPDFSGFKVPQVVDNANSLVMKLGATVNLDALAPVVTGGTGYPSLGLEFDMGNEVPFTALVGGETVDVTDRKVVGKVTLDLDAAGEVAQEASVLANTTTSLVFVHGTVAGSKVMLFFPNVQLTNPVDTDLNGRLLKSYDLVMVPSSSGNDEVRIVLF